MFPSPKIMVDVLFSWAVGAYSRQRKERAISLTEPHNSEFCIVLLFGIHSSLIDYLRSVICNLM